jgi:hypothetical protein
MDGPFRAAEAAAPHCKTNPVGAEAAAPHCKTNPVGAEAAAPHCKTNPVGAGRAEAGGMTERSEWGAGREGMPKGGPA